ncbi:cupredoxin domain-containing protein [Bacillus sp. F19]|nr:cupredoxin domain-containing protein [Bacillus sp. F19]
MRFVLIKKKWILVVAALVAIIGFGGWYYFNPAASPTLKMENSSGNLEINMVTGEFKSKTEDGKEIEAYRWDPGTIYVPEGKQVTLTIYGINGSEHPFRIEGTDITGVVKKGAKTVIPLKFEKEGIYRLICDTHSHHGQGVPMIAYIVVD